MAYELLYRGVPEKSQTCCEAGTENHGSHDRQPGCSMGQPGFLLAKAVFKGSWAQKEAEIEKIEIGCANRVRNVFNEWNSYGINDG